MKTTVKLSKRAQKEISRREVMTINTFLSYFDLFVSNEVDAHFLEDSIESYITYFFSNN